MPCGLGEHGRRRVAEVAALGVVPPCTAELFRDAPSASYQQLACVERRTPLDEHAIAVLEPQAALSDEVILHLGYHVRT
jgi:hypothetical protein